MGKPLKKPSQVPKTTGKKLMHRTVSPSSESAKVQAGKPLKKGLPTPKVPTSGPVPKVPKKWKWKGKKEGGRFKGYIRVKPEDMPPDFPRPHKMIVPDTFWLVDPTKGTVRQLSTVMPDKVIVGWSDCTVCSNTVARCICKSGFIHSRGVEWIYIRSLMRSDGIAFSSDSKIDSTSPTITQHGLYWYRPKDYAAVPAASRHVVRPSGHKTLPKPSERPTAKPLKPLKKKSGQKELASVDQSISSMTKDADRIASGLADKIKADLKKPSKKGKSLKGKK